MFMIRVGILILSWLYYFIKGEYKFLEIKIFSFFKIVIVFCWVVFIEIGVVIGWVFIVDDVKVKLKIKIC